MCVELTSGRPWLEDLVTPVGGGLGKGTVSPLWPTLLRPSLWGALATFYTMEVGGVGGHLGPEL